MTPAADQVLDFMLHRLVSHPNDVNITLVRKQPVVCWKGELVKFAQVHPGVVGSVSWFTKHLKTERDGFRLPLRRRTKKEATLLHVPESGCVADLVPHGVRGRYLVHGCHCELGGRVGTSEHATLRADAGGNASTSSPTDSIGERLRADKRVTVAHLSLQPKFLSTTAILVTEHLERHIGLLTKRIGVASDLESLQKTEAALRAELDALTQEGKQTREFLENDSAQLGRVRKQYLHFTEDMGGREQQLEVLRSDVRTREEQVKIKEDFLAGLVASKRVRLD